jgi:hypothetical protein
MKNMFFSDTWVGICPPPAKLWHCLDHTTPPEQETDSTACNLANPTSILLSLSYPSPAITEEKKHEKFVLAK